MRQKLFATATSAVLGIGVAAILAVIFINWIVTHATDLIAALLLLWMGLF